MKNILVIDAQGGGIGKQLISAIKARELPVNITAVGTNSVSTAAMLKAGADNGATGENPVVVNARSADIIVGPIGIVIADAMFGEITPVMSQAVAQSKATKILLPINKCENIIVGVENLNVSYLIEQAVEEISKHL